MTNNASSTLMDICRRIKAHFVSLICTNRRVNVLYKYNIIEKKNSKIIMFIIKFDLCL